MKGDIHEAFEIKAADLLGLAALTSNNMSFYEVAEMFFTEGIAYQKDTDQALIEQLAKALENMLLRHFYDNGSLPEHTEARTALEAYRERKP